MTSTNTHTSETTQPRDFAAFLVEQSNGRTHTELSEGLRDLVTRVIDTGKKGSITLTVNVEPMKNAPETLVVTDAIKLKLPEHDRKASIFWPDTAGNLCRTDPNQRSIFDVIELPHSGNNAAITVNPTTGEIQE